MYKTDYQGLILDKARRPNSLQRCVVQRKHGLNLLESQQCTEFPLYSIS